MHNSRYKQESQDALAASHQQLAIANLDLEGLTLTLTLTLIGWPSRISIWKGRSRTSSMCASMPNARRSRAKNRPSGRRLDPPP
jgi:hypothetical protein